MDGKTHKTIGICSGIIASEVMISSNISMENIILGGMLITGSILGSILLDIDKKGTLISKKVPFLSKIVRISTTHRGITHWFPFNALVKCNDRTNNINCNIDILFICHLLFCKCCYEKIQKK